MTNSRFFVKPAGKKKVAIAMSGGVDSGVAAALVVKTGYQAAGFHLKLWQEPQLDTPRVNRDRHLLEAGSREAARKTAHQLGIPFYVIDFEKIFKKKVVDYFLKEYSLGRTPNPCVVCNKFIKFRELLNYVKKLGYDYLATGHYARVMGGDFVTNFSLMSARKNKNIPPDGGTSAQIRSKLSLRPLTRKNYFHFLMGRDKLKDQSYFLYNLTQKQLAQVMFPVGDYQKTEVVKMAKKWKLTVAERPESQEICFFPESDYRPFLRRQIGEKIVPGEVVDTRDRVIGKHQGLPLYTIGQRRKFEVQNSKFKIVPPYYVIAKDAKKNRLVVGFGKEAEKKEFWVKDINWIDPLTAKHLPLSAEVRIRHQGELLECEVRRSKSKTLQTVVAPQSDATDLSDGSKSTFSEVKVVLTEPERGIAPGQAAVFYQDKKVLGGGIIALTLADRP